MGGVRREQSSEHVLGLAIGIYRLRVAGQGENAERCEGGEEDGGEGDGGEGEGGGGGEGDGGGGGGEGEDGEGEGGGESRCVRVQKACSFGLSTSRLNCALRARASPRAWCFSSFC